MNDRSGADAQPTPPARRGRGRIPEHPAGLCKRARIVLLLTDDDKAQIAAAASEAGLAVSPFVLACVRKDRGFREAVAHAAPTGGTGDKATAP